MRTTLSIRDDLYEIARKRAFDERRTLGDVVNELIERGIGEGAVERRRTLGAFEGRIAIADDFDDELPEVTASIHESIDP